MPEPIGVFGGTFDPVHYGHLRLAEEACAALQLARALWIPAGRPPHREAPRASSAHRLQMLRLAIAANPRFALDAAECESEAASYTVDTLARLRREHGATQPLVLLLGADAFAGLATWHRWQELSGLAHIAVATRPQHSLDAERLPGPLAALWRARLHGDPQPLAEAPAGLVFRFTITDLDIAATRIRQALDAGPGPRYLVPDLRYLLPDPVLDYIRAHHLYS